MRCLVTGSEGFIGRHLVAKLIEEGNTVVPIDLVAGRDVRTLKPSDFSYIDVVFHLAAQAKVQQSIDDPLFTNDHNVNGTLNVLWCSKQAGVQKVVYSASSSAYGEQTKLPLKEGANPNPLSPYGVQKMVGEYYCKVFSSLYGLKTVSLRYFNVYGENMPQDNPYNACIANFLKFRKDGNYLPMYGGNQKRDFTYVGDVVRANILAAKSEVGNGEVINIGSGKMYSIQEIADAVSDRQEHFEQRKGEPMETLADIRKAKRLLKWKPTTDVIEWLKNQN